MTAMPAGKWQGVIAFILHFALCETEISIIVPCVSQLRFLSSADMSFASFSLTCHLPLVKERARKGPRM
jgi:hypothetical protein